MGTFTLYGLISADEDQTEKDAYAGNRILAGYVVIKKEGNGSEGNLPGLVDTDGDFVGFSSTSYDFIYETMEEAAKWAKEHFGDTWKESAYVGEFHYTFSVKEVFDMESLPKINKVKAESSDEDDGLDDVDLSEDLLGLPEEPVQQRKWYLNLTTGEPVPEHSAIWDALESIAKPYFDKEGRDKDHMVSGYYWRY